jgi:hypothetical protein
MGPRYVHTNVTVSSCGTGSESEIFRLGGSVRKSDVYGTARIACVDGSEGAVLVVIRMDSTFSIGASVNTTVWDGVFILSSI